MLSESIKSSRTKSEMTISYLFTISVGLELTVSRGGPAEMLKVSKPRQLAEGVTMSPARLMLEILAIYETFGTFNIRMCEFG